MATRRLRRRSSSPPPSPSPFFKLPREIRDSIYSHVFSDTTASGRPGHRKFLHPYDCFAVEHDYSGQEVIHGAVWTEDPKQNGYSLLAVCDQVRAEALPFAIRGTEFDLRWLLKRQMSTSGWKNYNRSVDPWMHSISYISGNSIALRTLFYGNLGANIRFITIQYEQLERETWTAGRKRALKWWPKHVKLDQLTIVAMTKHDDRLFSHSWVRTNMIERFLELWALVSPRKLTKKLVLEAQELCSQQELTTDLADQLSSAAKQLLEKEIVGSLPNEIVIEARPALDLNKPEEAPQRVQDAITQNQPLPVTLALVSLVERTDETRKEPTVKDLQPYSTAEDAEASLVKPFQGPRPRESWEYSDEMIRMHGSRRRRWSWRHKRLMRNAKADREEMEEESETEKLFSGIKDEINYTVERARVVLKAKRHAAENPLSEVENTNDDDASSSSDSPTWYGEKPSARKKKTKEASKASNEPQPIANGKAKGTKRLRDAASDEAPNGRPLQRRKTELSNGDSGLFGSTATASATDERSSPRPVRPSSDNLDQEEPVSNGLTNGAKPHRDAHTLQTKGGANADTAELDALMQERNRLDAEILRKLTQMRSEIK